MQGKIGRGAKQHDFGFLTLIIDNKKNISSILNLMLALSSASQNPSESYTLVTVWPGLWLHGNQTLPVAGYFFKHLW